MSEPPTRLLAPPGGGGPVETLSELLRCYICTDALQDASLCPNCSKMSCYSCIRRWVTNDKANCPHCRAPLTESSLIRVPLFDELRHELEQLPTNPLDGNPQFRERLCSQHKEKVSVFCETCRLCVCHECVLWPTSPHHNHNYVKLEVLLQKQREICERQLHRLHEHMKRVLNQVQAVERKMEAVKGSKIKVRREMKEAFEKMSERLESQYETKQEKLGVARQTLKGQAMQLTRATRDLENKIKSGSITCLLSENGELRKEVLDKLEELQSIEIEPMPSIGEFLNEMVPSYTTSVFKVHPYSQLRDQGEEVYSKPLHMYGTTWRLKIYPNGHRDDTGLYLSVFLELTEGYDKKFKYQYCIEMLYNCSNKHPSRNYRKEYVSDFADGESWGYRKFYELAKLESDGFLRDDTLVLRFSVRALTTHQKCRDLSTHVRRLEHKVESLQKELKQTKENARPSSSGSGSTTSSTQGHNEAAPASYPNSPSRSRSVRHQHQHSHSEPISPNPANSSPQVREERSRDRHYEQAVRREQERQRSEERRREERRREQERRYNQERRRERERRTGERERGYRGHLQVAMSQQHSVRNHSQQLPGVKERGYLSQQRHSDSRLVPMEPPPPPQTHPYHSQQRRESGESLRQHRRRSADPTLLQHHFDNPISPPMFRHSLAPPPTAISHGSSQQHLHFRRDSFGSAADDTEFGSQASLLASPARHGGERAPRFEDGSGDETGCSQPHPWGESLSHNDIQISIQEVAHSAVARPHHPPSGHLHLYHAQSQEQFIDEDEFGGGGGGGGGRVVPETMFNLYDDGHVHHSFKSSDMPSHTSALSQPVHSTRRRLQSSVPDLSLLTVTSTSNLAQGLSQSVLDMSRQRGGGDHAPSGLRPHHDIARGNGAHRSSSQSYHLNRMPSDPHLNTEAVHHPGLARTLLARLKEEPEQSPATHTRQTRGGAVGRASSSQPPRRGYSEIRNRRRTPSPHQPSQTQPASSHQSHETTGSGHTSSQRASSGSTSSSNPELTPTNAQPPPPSSTSTTTDTLPINSLTTGTLGLAGKSSSNTSLSNLDLIW